MKIGKILLSLVLVVILALGVGFWYLFSNINELVKEAVQTVGSDTLHTSVSLNNVDIKLVDGSGALKGFSIANYPGFQQSELLGIDEIKLDVDPRSLNKDVIVIDELLIDGMSVTAEQLGNTTNIQTLLDSLPQSSETETAQPEGAEQSVLLAVKKLSFVNSKLSLATENYGKHSLSLPNIVRANLGSASKGLTPEQLAEEIVRPLIKEIKTQVEEGIGDLAEEALKEKLDEKLDEEKERLKEKVDEKLGEGAADKIKDLKKLLD